MLAKLKAMLIIVLEIITKKLRGEIITSVTPSAVNIDTKNATSATKNTGISLTYAKQPLISSSAADARYAYNAANPRPLYGREKLREQLHLAHCTKDQCYREDGPCPVTSGVAEPYFAFN